MLPVEALHRLNPTGVKFALFLSKYKFHPDIALKQWALCSALRFNPGCLLAGPGHLYLITPLPLAVKVALVGEQLYAVGFFG